VPYLRPFLPYLHEMIVIRVASQISHFKRIAPLPSGRSFSPTFCRPRRSPHSRRTEQISPRQFLLEFVLGQAFSFPSTPRPRPRSLPFPTESIIFSQFLPIFHRNRHLQNTFLFFGAQQELSLFHLKSHGRMPVQSPLPSLSHRFLKSDDWQLISVRLATPIFFVHRARRRGFPA